MSVPELPSVDPNRRFGAHTSASGGLHNAVRAGREVGCDVVQVFTKSPRQWRAKTLTDADVEQFWQAQRETGIPCVAAHDTYLINPAAPDAEILARSREALRDEFERTACLRIPCLVMHLGATPEPDEIGVPRLAESVRYVLDATSSALPRLLLEITAGQGHTLGYTFEHLAEVMERVDDPRLGICLDTCHLFAAGYDVRDPESYAATMERLDAIVGLRHIHLVHANDSKRELGSRVDRHEHLGQGHIGREAFRQLVTDPRLAHAPFVLETPKEGDMDPVNLGVLRELTGSESPARGET